MAYYDLPWFRQLRTRRFWFEERGCLRLYSALIMLLLGLQVGFLLNDLGGPSPGRKGFITDWEAMVSLETFRILGLSYLCCSSSRVNGGLTVLQFLYIVACCIIHQEIYISASLRGTLGFDHVSIAGNSRMHALFLDWMIVLFQLLIPGLTLVSLLECESRFEIVKHLAAPENDRLHIYALYYISRTCMAECNISLSFISPIHPA
jgi:hypothetical protein